MHTLFDFITQIKGIEYLIAVSSIAGFIILWELLKPRPFRSVIEAGREDVSYIRSTGYGNAIKTMGKVLAAPFIGLLYIIVLPFTFFLAIAIIMAEGAAKLFGPSASFGWRPIEAYLTGRKSGKKAKKA